MGRYFTYARKASGERIGTTTGEIRSAGEQQSNDHRLEPREASAARFGRGNSRGLRFSAIDRGFDYDRSGGQQHGIDGSEIISLAVKQKENGKANQIAPAERAVGLEPR